MKKNYWMWIVILLVVIAVGYWYYSIAPESAAPSTAEEVTAGGDQADQAIDSMVIDDGTGDLEEEIPEVAQ